jgi:putative transposase
MQVMSNGRVRRSGAEWREVLDRQNASGLSAEEFCEREGIRLGSFMRWQAKLAAGRVAREFVSVRPVSPAMTAPSWSLEVILPNGCRLRFGA